MATGWVDTDRGAFSRYKSVWLLSTTQQLITLGLGVGNQRSPIQFDLYNTHKHTQTQVGLKLSQLKQMQTKAGYVSENTASL